MEKWTRVGKIIFYGGVVDGWGRERLQRWRFGFLQGFVYLCKKNIYVWIVENTYCSLSKIGRQR